MLDLNILFNKINDGDDVLTDIDNSHTELAHEESTGIPEKLEYLLNSELIQWNDFFNKPVIVSILDRINKSINYDNSSPHIDNIFRSYNINPTKVNLMIIGMDPYPQVCGNIRVANGIPFSVTEKLLAEGYRAKSLENIMIELENDLGISTEKFDFGYLMEQNVFMINCAHTVNIGLTAGNSGSHMDLWLDYTKLLLTYMISLNKNLIVAILGSGVSYNLRDELYSMSDRCITTGHPSRPDTGKNPFFGSCIFSNINRLLPTKINWVRP